MTPQEKKLQTINLIVNSSVFTQAYKLKRIKEITENHKFTTIKGDPTASLNK